MKREVKLEKEWTTKDGYKAAVIKYPSHRCGYVALPEGHPLNGMGYSTPYGKWSDFKNKQVGKRGPIDLFCMALTDKKTEPPHVGHHFDVHGSITFMETKKDYPIKTYSPITWVGFDCNHCDDIDDPKSEEYVVAECERLSSQLKEHENNPRKIWVFE